MTEREKSPNCCARYWSRRMPSCLILASNSSGPWRGEVSSGPSPPSSTSSSNSSLIAGSGPEFQFRRRGAQLVQPPVELLDLVPLGLQLVGLRRVALARRAVRVHGGGLAIVLDHL